MKLGNEKEGHFSTALSFFFVLHFFSGIVWQFYFHSKKQLSVSSFLDRCFLIVFSSSTFLFHRLLIVVMTFRLSFHRHRYQNLKPFSFTKLFLAETQKFPTLSKRATLLYVQNKHFLERFSKFESFSLSGSL